MVVEVRDYRQAFLSAADHLWGVHACENDRGVPGGGLVPWDAVGGTLCEAEFDGYVMLETYNSSLGDFAARNGVFQDVCPDGWEFARQGVSFLRKTFCGDRTE
jgi:D-psicose/D-tagatose/L-ribulose 3-epimerase